MKQTTLHMIGNAHLDPVWLWRWQEGFQAAKATFRAALQLMDETDDFVFTSSSAAIYDWIESNDPPMFAAIKQRVAEGRWCMVGGWWLQPDCNLPSGESFVRHGLYGQRFFREKFGVVATVGYNVDSFGHHAMLPQILRKSGMDSYVFMRPEPFEKGLPGRVFWWEADDGSRVLAFRIPFEYHSRTDDLATYVQRIMPELKAPTDELMCFYGVGNHGGGPTRGNLESIRAMDANPTFPRLSFSTPERFFAAARGSGQTFPVVHDDLQHHASGCYAAHSGIKRWNREAENLLVAAEKLLTVAELVTGLPYPMELAHAWQDVLFNQFHDILAGTSLEQAYHDARDMHGEAMAIGQRAANNALQAIGSGIGIATETDMTPIVVFNPHTWPARVPVEVELGDVTPQSRLLDPSGGELPMQMGSPSVVVSGWRRRISFVADLPPLGYRVFRLQADAAAAEVAPLSAGAEMIENERFRLRFDLTTGYIASLYDKTREIEVFGGPAAVPVVIADESDTWGHGVYQFQEVAGAFTATDVRLVEHGPVKAVMRVQSSYGTSQVTQYFTMYHDLPQITVRVRVDWREQLKMLKLRFPLNLYLVKPTYEIPYGTIERPANGEEEPGLNWIDVTGIERTTGALYGVSLLNDGKYSFDVRGTTMSVTVLRSPPYAHHIPAELQSDEEYAWMDQGIQWFTYTLLPHEGSWETAGAVQRAAELNQPPLTLVESYHDGPLPQQASYLSVDQPNIIASVVKRAEDDDATVVRCYETTKTATDATIRLPLWERVIEARFGPCEIKTFRVPRGREEPVSEVNLIEWAYDEPGRHTRHDGGSL